MKQTSKQAEILCKQRGYVRTILGRRRHLKPRFAYRAFNTVIQGSAGDVLRIQLIAVDKMLRQKYGNDAHVVTVVHDDIVTNSPAEIVNEVSRDVATTMKETADALNCRVPFIVDTHFSNKTWAGCKD